MGGTIQIGFHCKSSNAPMQLHLPSMPHLSIWMERLSSLSRLRHTATEAAMPPLSPYVRAPAKDHPMQSLSQRDGTLQMVDLKVTTRANTTILDWIRRPFVKKTKRASIRSSRYRSKSIVMDLEINALRYSWDFQAWRPTNTLRSLHKLYVAFFIFISS